jgi:HPt (histidine-containing phosphotransfer) domain-containing protein
VKKGKVIYMERTGKQLREIGIDVDSVVSRLGGNEEIYLSICRKFIDDPSYSSFQKAIIENDIKAVEIHIHTLKGVAANLGFTRLELISRKILNNIKDKESSYLKDELQELSEEYHKIITVLK